MRYFIKSTRHIAISTIGAGRLVYQADSTSIYILPASLAQAQFFGSVSGLFFPHGCLTQKTQESRSVCPSPPRALHRVGPYSLLNSSCSSLLPPPSLPIKASLILTPEKSCVCVCVRMCEHFYVKMCVST